MSRPIFPNFTGTNPMQANTGPYNPNINMRMTSSYASIFNPMNSLLASKITFYLFIDHSSPMMHNLNINHQISSTPLATSSTIMNLLNKTSLPSSGEYKKVYVGRIPPGLSDTFILKLLEVIIYLK